MLNAKEIMRIAPIVVFFGHTIGLCRKKRQVQGKAQVENNNNEPVDFLPHKCSANEPNQWVAKTKNKVGSKPLAE